jgi:uncharacterized protein YjaZ
MSLIDLRSTTLKWTLHFLEAEGSLAPWRTQLTTEARGAHENIARRLAPDVAMPRIDILIQRVAKQVIPELGMTGSSFRRGCMAVTLDPENPNFETSLESGQFTRTLTHELHHCLRHSGAGYGVTLSEAFVSEGLADHFDREINGGDGQIWNHALEPSQWPLLLQQAEEAIHMRRYNYENHALWFFGARADIETAGVPRWAGYTIGYHLIESYLHAFPEMRPSRMATTPAAEIVAKAWPLLRARFAITANEET